MPLNAHIAERLEGIRQVLVAQGRASGPMSSASKGSERELFIREFLAKVFPPHIRFGSGDITDAKGNKSGQVDIVTELPFFPSFPVPGGDQRLYMAEGVAAAVEVKSDLSAQWGQVERTAASVQALAIRRIRTMWIGKRLSEHIPVIAVGYTGYTTLDGLVERFESTSPDCRPDVALVLGDPGFFVAEHDADTLIATDGPEAMFYFLARFNWYCTKLITASFSADAYLNEADGTTS